MSWCAGNILFVLFLNEMRDSVTEQKSLSPIDATMVVSSLCPLELKIIIKTVIEHYIERGTI